MPEKRLPAVSPGTGLGPDQRVLGFREDGLPMKENPLLELRAGAEKLGSIFPWPLNMTALGVSLWNAVQRGLF